MMEADSGVVVVPGTAIVPLFATTDSPTASNKTSSVRWLTATLAVIVSSVIVKRNSSPSLRVIVIALVSPVVAATV